MLTNKNKRVNLTELRLTTRTLIIEQQCDPENSKEYFRRLQEKSKSTKVRNQSRLRIQEARLLESRQTFIESLILAQDERWRRA